MVSRESCRAPGTLAFTVVEVLVCIAILLILAAMLNTAWVSVAPKVAQAQCFSNMRSIHGSLSTYLTDVGHWPQIPTKSEDNEETYETWWLATLEPYGGVAKVWQCPVLRSRKVQDADGYVLRMHYIPTDFDANPISPRRWSTMPWLIERGNNHGRGALLAFPDGSIRTSL